MVFSVKCMLTYLLYIQKSLIGYVQTKTKDFYIELLKNVPIFIDIFWFYKILDDFNPHKDFFICYLHWFQLCL